MKNDFYVYVYLDPRKPGIYSYNEFKFNFEPFYIGKGKNNRMFYHLQNKPLSKKSHKSNKINKILSMGYKPIVLKIIGQLSENISLEVEEKLIKLIGTYKNSGTLTNIKEHGCESMGYKHDYDSIQKQIFKQSYPVQKLMNNKVIKEYPSVKICSEVENFSNNFIINCCKGRTLPKDGSDFRYKNIELRNIYKEKKRKFKHIKQNKEVYWFDKEGGLLGKFDSIREASRKTNTLRIYVSKCCNGKIRTSVVNKYYFSFEEVYIEPTDIRKPKSPVMKIGLDDEVIETYESISQASRANNISRRGITAVLSENNIQKTAGGYKWKRASDWN